jgi:hypothetical protein
VANWYCVTIAVYGPKVHASKCSEEIFAYPNQFSYASNFESGDSRYLGEIALFHCRVGTGSLHLCCPHRDHRLLEAYSYAGHMAALYTDKLKGISGSLRSDFRLKHNAWERFCGTHSLAVSHRRRDSAFNILRQRVEHPGTIKRKGAAVIATPARAIYVLD